MVWVCPSLSRPERLARLALSWERCQPRTPLHIRLWKNDPRKVEYYQRRWPKSWHFYESMHKALSPSMTEFALEYRPEQEAYGFIADDIVLRTPGGLELLHALAEPCYVAYPNDTIQRHKLATHFCVGGELVRKIGWFGWPGVAHSVDVPMTTIGRMTGLLRYAPFVIFDHQHFLKDPKLYDATYREMYREGSNQPDTEVYDADMVAIRDALKPDGELVVTAIGVMRWIHTLAESESDEWAAQDRADAVRLGLPLNSEAESPESRSIH